MTAEMLLTHYAYLVAVVLAASGLFIVFASRNLVKRMIGLGLFQTSAGVLYISLGKAAGGTAPIRVEPASATAKALAAKLDPDYVARAGVDGVVYSNPLPHVLILTAIVVGVATLAVGLAIAVRVREAYGTIEADRVAAMDVAAAAADETAAEA